MQKNRKVKASLKQLDSDITIIKSKKKRMMTEHKVCYCPACRKYYPEKSCSFAPIVVNGFLEEMRARCLKKHEWDAK